LAPGPKLFAAMRPGLLAAIGLQRDTGGLAQLPWLGWLAGTIEAGVRAAACTLGNAGRQGSLHVASVGPQPDE